MNLNLLNQNSYQFLNLIDWEPIVNEIASNAYFDEAKSKIKELPRARSKEEIQNDLEQVSSAIKEVHTPSHESFYQKVSSIPSHINFEELLKKVEKEVVLSIQEIHYLITLFEISLDIQKNFKFFIEEFEPSKISSINKNAARPFRQFVSQSGEIDYFSHPIIGKLYRQRNHLDKKVNEILKEKIYSWKQEEIIQIDTYDIINGHYVLMVKSNRYRHDLGGIVAHSESGQTLYIEPHKIRSLSRERIDLSQKIEEEIFKICLDFTRKIREDLTFFTQIKESLLRIDYYLCIASYSVDNKLTCPELTEKHLIDIEGFFHPLIKNPVYNNLSLFENNNGIIISGPNTGGKTVTLKSLCLVTLFLHKGFFVPAKYAKLYPFPEIYFLSQDHQSLEEGLSSFAAESIYYIELAKQLGPRAILFIDEIFNSTSSEEASALAIGFFEYFQKKSNLYLFVSTHHQMLKVKTHESKEYISCHMEFDEETKKPTYKMTQGTPGSSLAIETFQRLSKDLGFTEEITRRALSILDQKYQEYERLLRDVSLKKSQYEKELNHYKDLNNKLSNQLDAQKGIIKLKMNQELENFNEEISRIRKEAYTLLEDAKSGGIRKKEIESRIHQLKNEVPFVDDNSNNSEAQQYSPLQKAPKIGDFIFHVPMKKEGEVIKVNRAKRKATVLLEKSFRIEAKFSDLTTSQKKSNKQESFQFNLNKKRESSLRIDGRGMRLEEFQERVEVACSDLMMGEVPYLEVVHGHGDGILKGWLRKSFAKKHDFQLEIPTEFQDGVTIIKLK